MRDDLQFTYSSLIPWTGEAPSFLVLQDCLLLNFSPMLLVSLPRVASRQNCVDLDVEEEEVEEGQDAGDDQPGQVVVVEDVARRESHLRWLPVHQVILSVSIHEHTLHLDQTELKELGQVDEDGDEDRGQDEGGKMAKV